MRSFTLGMLLVLVYSITVPAGDTKVAFNSPKEESANQQETRRLLVPPYQTIEHFLAAPQPPSKPRYIAGDERIVVAYVLPKGQAKNDDWYERTATLLAFVNTYYQDASAAMRGDAKPENGGLQFEFDSSHSMVRIHLIFGKGTANAYTSSPESLRQEVYQHCGQANPAIKRHLKNFAFLIFVEGVGVQTPEGKCRWQPIITPEKQTAILSAVTVKAGCIGKTIPEEMAYLTSTTASKDAFGRVSKFRDPTPFVAPAKDIETLPYGINENGSQSEVSENIIRVTTQSLAFALGCPADDRDDITNRVLFWTLRFSNFVPGNNPMHARKLTFSPMTAGILQQTKKLK